ncbi:helix-turn-helix domain-containing protein, partial [Clostridium tarantellae]
HINSQYLSRLFKKEIGISYSDYLNTLRVNNACSLLVNTSYTNYRIAIDSGFTDSAYFSKVFTKHIKVTPSKYRKMHIDKSHKILSSN